MTVLACAYMTCFFAAGLSKAERQGDGEALTAWSRSHDSSSAAHATVGLGWVRGWSYTLCTARDASRACDSVRAVQMSRV